MNATRADLRFFAGCLVAFAYDAWNTATEPARAWLARQDEKAASALGGRRVKTALIAGYLGSIVVAAYAVTHVGTQYAPGDPHVLPVWPGIDAPSGVYFVGLTLVLRDLLQRRVSKPAMYMLILVGAALSAVVSPTVAFASGVAFLISESIDYATFSLAEPRLGTLGGIAVSNAVSIVVDSAIFLAVAYNSLAFVEGQVIGKALASLAALVVLAVLPRRAVTA